MSRAQTAERDRARLEVAIESLRRSGSLRMCGTGSSMTPTIRAGSRVLIRRAGLDEVRRGEIVLIGSERGVRLHRLVDVRHGSEGAWLVTRGDNDMDNDPPVRASQLLGVYVRTEDAPSLWRRSAWFFAALLRRAEPA